MRSLWIETWNIDFCFKILYRSLMQSTLSMMETAQGLELFDIYPSLAFIG